MGTYDFKKWFEREDSTPSTSVSSASPIIQHIKTTSLRLDELLNRRLSEFFENLLVYESKKAQAHRVDGLIIGTGEADFTKGNTIYPLNYEGKNFQLIDVPGIEGDESKYADMVKEAVAKAHLVFYVNGTNKKPEKGTAQKIRDYLRFGTKVCPLVNVRGNADAYEFEEDRVSLTDQGGSSEALRQTEEVLGSVLDNDTLQKGYCVQGLLAFSALAVEKETGRSTIHASRNQDLIIQQRNYNKHFDSSEEMYEFSQIDSVASVLREKISTFREDIIESNKVKVLKLLTENVETLKMLYKKHQEFVKKTKPEFDEYRSTIEDAQKWFERQVRTRRNNLLDDFINRIKNQSDDIIESDFGDDSVITNRLEHAFDTELKSLKNKLKGILEQELRSLHEGLQQAMERLLEDVSRVQLEQMLYDVDAKGFSDTLAALELGSGFSGYGKVAFNIGSYALIGAGLGAAVPVIGNIIGGIAGAVVGILMSLLDIFSTKKTRIRRAQERVHARIDESYDKMFKALSDDQKKLFTLVRKQIKENDLIRLQQLEESLKHPLTIINKQITLMDYTKEQLEKLPYGTIQAIQY